MRGQDLSIAKEFKEMGYGEALESDSAALGWLEKNKRKFGHFIDSILRRCNDAATMGL